MRRIALIALLPLAAALADDAELRARAERECAAISAVLESYLGRKFEAPVPVELRTKEELGAFARETAKSLIPAGLVEVAQKLAVRLRLVPAGFDLLEKEIEMVERSVLGLYDPAADRFYVAKGAGSPGTPLFTITAAHELVHAYRDVDKDFWQRQLHLVQSNSDAAQALRFLVEGDATLLGLGVGPAVIQKREPGPMVEAIARNTLASDLALEAAISDPSLREFPLALRETLVAAYLEGQAFAAAVFRAGGKEALDRAYDAPPRSTERVLHPGKYVGPDVDEPTVLEGGDPTGALGEGWTLLHTDVPGELDIRILFTETLGRPRARAAADGWDGARLWFCEKAGQPAFLGVATTWDRPEDAAEFASAWAEWAHRRDGREGAPDGRDGEWRVETKEGLVVVRSKGTGAVVADGVPAERADGVLAAIELALPR